MATDNRYLTQLPRETKEFSMKPGSTFGVYDTFRNGMSSVRASSSVVHPLEISEKNFHKHKQQEELASLRKAQGVHMAMKLQMERATLSKIQRLPGLKSSRVGLRTVLCDDIQLGFEDMFENSAQEQNFSHCNLPLMDHSDMY
eukprot:gene7214-8022_t